MTQSRYFIAVILRGNSLEKAEQIRQSLFDRFGLKGALRSPPHITLHRPFEWKSAKEPELIKTLETFSFGMPFEVEFRDFSGFGERVLYIGVEKCPELERLHSALRRFALKELKLLNEAEDLRGFHPHVTVAFRDLRKRQFDEVREYLKTFQVNEIMQVEGFSLLRLEEKWREIAFFPFRKPTGEPG